VAHRAKSRVIIAALRSLDREGLAAYCEIGDWEVVAQCADEASAVQAIRSLRPDVTLVEAKVLDTPVFYEWRDTTGVGKCCATRPWVLYFFLDKF